MASASGDADIRENMEALAVALRAKDIDRLMTYYAPDVVVFDAHGVAHPRRFGLASYGGVHWNVPSVGCAKSILVGAHGPLAAERGSTAPLIHQGEVIGAAVRSRSGVAPVYVSAGHLMDLNTAVDIVLRLTPRFREPETTRRAHRRVNDLRREEMG